MSDKTSILYIDVDRCEKIEQHISHINAILKNTDFNEYIIIELNESKRQLERIIQLLNYQKYLDYLNSKPETNSEVRLTYQSRFDPISYQIRQYYYQVFETLAKFNIILK